MTFFDHQAASVAIFGLDHNPSGIGIYKDLFRARASDDGIAEKGQSGGVVTGLLCFALNQGLIDAAVVAARESGPGFAKGVVVTSSDQVLESAGSKYMTSHSLSSLREALDAGHGRIALVGLPCQVKSIVKTRLTDTENESISERISLVIGLFCNWAFSAREFSRFLSQELGDKRINRFEIPPPPADTLEISTDSGLVKIPLHKTRPYIQAACSLCDDMTSQFADISVGAFEPEPGWNTLITRTERGADFVGRAIDGGELTVKAYPWEELSRLAEACDNKRKRAVKREPDSRE
jgi:coenzyme F420 hydrogenase subunit beta